MGFCLLVLLAQRQMTFPSSKRNPAPLTFQTVKQDLREDNKSPFYKRNLAIKFLLKIIKWHVLKVL